MREILFRGKRVDNGEWVYGYYAHLPSAAGAANIIYVPASDPDDSNHTVFVDPETIGQFTGLTDKNGTKIFEGDIINFFGKDFLNCLVTFDKGSFWFEFLSEFTRKIRNQKRDLIFSNVSICGEVIGNQYDNPELIEKEENTNDRT